MGLDTGGTFTDVLAVRGAERLRAKVPSTPDRPEQAFLAALRAVGAGAGTRVHHGTTVATNAVLTRSGARTAFVTTAGFEDLPWIGRGSRDDLHALAPGRTPPLLERRLVFGLEERLDARGVALRRPTRAALQRLRAQVRHAAPQAVAVCLLHAVHNDAHERAVQVCLADLGLPLYLSSRSSPDPREVERGVTTVLDAYVAPVLCAYLEAVGRELPPHGALSVMRSDGGRMSVAEVAAAPARTLLSGPAAGVAAARALATRLGYERVLSFDVGGTSTDVAWIEGDDLAVRPSLRVASFEAGVPSVGLETVGAGGGSVVSLDAGGALRVGPESAGAQPGPAAYGWGGPFTLTDAWLLRKRVPAALLAGAFPLDPAAAERAGRTLARKVGCTLRVLCDGVMAVAAATTARALRLASVAQGHDPRRAVLVAFGGAGPLLGAETAARLGIETLCVPVDPGTFAAEGALLAPLRADAAEVLSGAAGRLALVRRRLQARVRATLRAEGARRCVFRAEVEARYAGQAFEVTVPYGADWQASFHRRHERRYGFALEARPVEPVRLRVRGEGHEGGAPPSPSQRTSGRTAARDRVRGASLQRSSLGVGDRVRGAARIVELSGTTWVPAGWEALVLPDGTLQLSRGSA